MRLSRAYFNVQLITISADVKSNLQLKKVNCAVVVVTCKPHIHPSFHGLSARRCPLSPHLGYRHWLWYPGLSPVLVSIALSFAFHISVFSTHSSSSAIGFHSSIFYGGGICTPPPTLLIIPELGLALWQLDIRKG